MYIRTVAGADNFRDRNENISASDNASQQSNPLGLVSDLTLDEPLLKQRQSRIDVLVRYRVVVAFIYCNIPTMST